MDPTKRAEYEEEIAKITALYRAHEPKELDRETVIDCVKRLEEAKYKAQMKMYELVRKQRLPPNVINNVIKIEELRAGDQFFYETGIEESDVEPNMKRLNMDKDEECKAIIAEFAEKSKKFLADKQAETIAMVKKAHEMKTMVEQ